MQAKLLKLIVTLLAVASLTGCLSQKLVPTTPETMVISTADSQENFHQMLVLAAKYRKYEILSDNGSTKMTIKYSRLASKGTEMSSITYDVVNSKDSYTMSYVDSENFEYKDGKINGKYAWYINNLYGVLKKMYEDPEYLARVKIIVAHPNIHH
jgi:hypothetical protein